MPNSRPSSGSQRDFGHYRASWEQSADALLLADSNTARIVDANPQAERLLGRSLGELIGLHIIDIYPADQSQLAAASFAAGVAGNDEPAKLDVLWPDGVRIAVEVHAHLCPPLRRCEPMVLVTLHDFIERQLAEHEAASRNWALSAIHRATVAAMDADSELDLMNANCVGIASEGATTFIALANDDEEHSLTIVSAQGPGAAFVKELDLSWADVPKGQVLAARAIRTGTTQIVHNARDSERLAPLAATIGVESVMAVPLQDGDRVLGAIAIFSPVPGVFGAFEQGLFEDVARQLVLGMRVRREKLVFREQVERNRRQEEHVRLALEQTVAAIAATIEYRDPYTAGHERSVAELSEKVARELGMPSDVCHGLFLAGLLHDVGKIKVPVEILCSPGRLNELEYGLIQMHAEVGYEILRGIEFPWPVADIARQHHERIDGSGYPQHLRGPEIILEAQIVACADIVDSMCSHRPYRAGLGLERALDELRTLRGVKLDAGVVDATLHVMQQAG